MLVLSRKANEAILIGDEVTVRVIKIKGNTVQLGIEAPREISILRAELTPQDKSADRTSQLDIDRSEVGNPDCHRLLLCTLAQ